MKIKKSYCCIDMENAVLKGIVECVDVVLGEPQFDTYYIEAVKYRKKKNRLLWDIQEIVTEDIILKYCSYCGKEL